MDIGHWRWWGNWIVVAALAGCGGGGGGSEGPPETVPTPTGEATVGAAGGTVVAVDGVRLQVPAGALSSAVTLRVARDTTGMNAALLGVAPDPTQSVDLSPTYALTPHGTRFAEPVELRIPLNTSTAAGQGTLAVLRTEPGQGSWMLMPVAKVEGGAVVVAIDGFSFYKVVRLVQMPPPTLSAPPAPFLIDMAATFDGVGPETFTIPSVTNPNNLHRRLYGEITTRTQNLRYAGRIVGLPARCANITLNGQARFPKSARAEDASGGTLGTGYSQEPAFAQATAASGTTTVNGHSYPTLDFAFDLNMANAPYQRSVFEALRAANNTGATPTVAVSFNAWASCTTPVDMGGGNLIGTWKIAPGSEKVHDAAFNMDFIDDKGWVWNTVQYKVDYLPQGYITHPSDLTVAAGASASFATSAWPTPVGEQRIEWWRSNNDGASWSRVRTSLVPVSDTADTYTLPSVAATDHNALFRARLCTVPRQAAVAESCNDGIPARLSVIQGATAASFVQQPHPLLVRTGQTAGLSVQVAGSPAPALRWQSRPANSSAAWVDVTSGTGSGSPNYSTAALSLADNGLQLRAVASNLAGEVASVPVTVSVSDQDVAPSVLTQPASLSVVAGSEAVFAVVARGTEALSYQWRRNGQPISGANAPLIKLSNVSNSDASVYSVQVSNAAGQVLSADATLQVSAGAAPAVAPTIVTPPAAVTVNEGNTATFAVGVGGSTPLSYQWLKEGQPIEGATAAYYSLAAVTTGSAGSYAVRVSNAAGSVTSAAASLTVHAVVAPVAVSISTQPSPQVQLPGGSATFAVAASGSGPLQYQWLKDGTAISGATAAVLNLGNLTAADVGSYSVTVGNALGSVNSSAAALTVVGAPAVITQPAATSVAAGATASFSVTASGQGLRYQWLRNGLPIGSATDASYTTPALTVADSGAVYSVAVYNGAGLVFSQGALLTVTSSAASASAYGKLSAFYGHVCAVTASGHVYCWGKGDSGQLGDGRSADTSTPVRAAGIANAEFVAAGYTATCAIHDGGKLSCWGDKLDDTGSAATPVFKGISDATWAAVGFYHVCYVNTHGEIWCWGSNTYGALGDGTRTSRSSPVQVKWADGTALTGAVSVAASSYSTCATLASGQVWCWGKDVSDAARTAPARVRRLNFDGQRLELTTQGHAVAGIDHFCANDANPTSARPVCWGFNNGGQLGDYWVPSVMSTPNSPHDDATPTGQNEVGEQQLASGGDHSCSLNYPAGDGTNLRCWGRTFFGNGADTEVLGPTAAAGLANYNLNFGAPIHAIAAGPRFTCALRSGAVLCWGDNSFGQIGNGSTTVQTVPAVTSLGAVFWQP